ncbi:HDOD domain-containing protein [Endothiovibrio diazotrophicus]
MLPTINGLVEDVAELVSLPEVCSRVNQLVDDPEIGIPHLADAIGQDPALTVRLLRVANGPLYGFSGSVHTVPHACDLLGRERVRELLLATTASHLFDGLPNELVSTEDFWRHSLYCALAARHLASHTALAVEPEVLFTAGMLHDVGDLVLFNRMPEAARSALLLAMEGPGDPEIQEAERQVFGFEHSQVGAALARRWQLPPLIVECIEYHHAPERAPQHPEAAAVVHIANTVAYWAELNSHDRGEAPQIHPEAWELTGLTAADADAALEAARTMIGGAQALFLG